MKLTLKNVARISSVEIDIGGITVIAGPNGAGKSTISRAAMTLCSVSSRLPLLVQAERVSSILNILRESFGKFGADMFPVEDPLGKRRKFWGIWLSPEWWENLEEGLPLWQEILGSSGSSEHLTYVDNLITQRIFNTQGVTAIIDYEGTWNSSTRQYNFNSKINTIYSETTIEGTI